MAWSSEKDAVVASARKLLLVGYEGRETRFGDAIRKNEDMYNGKNPPALRGRSNIPFDTVVMGGFVDTLHGQTSPDVTIGMEPTREQDKIAAQKISAVATRETAPDRGDWNKALRDAKFLSILSGRGTIKPMFESIPNFRADLDVVDHYDFITENTGGADLDALLYKFQDGLFRTPGSLKDGAADGFYDRGQVQMVISRMLQASYQKNIADQYSDKLARYRAAGINVTGGNDLVGQELAKMCEGVVQVNDKWWYVFFEPTSGLGIRCERLEDVFEHAKYYRGRGPWASFATHRHPKLFWSKAAADDIRPIAYTMKKILNYTVDNMEKNVWDQKAFDPKMFTNAADLLYRQDALVRATLKPGQRIQDGIFQFKTPDNSQISINMIEWMNNFLGQKTGITPDAAGESDADQVGILVSNIEQVSKRYTLLNRDFSRALTTAGVMLDFGIHANLREKYAVKIIGNNGIRWEETVEREDTDCDFSVTVTDGTEAATNDLATSKKKEAFFASVDLDPTQRALYNPKWYAEQKIKMGGWDEADIRTALDTNNDGDEMVMAHAAQAIQDCIEGKDLYEMYRGATTGFVQKILDYCEENYPLIPRDQLAKMTPAKRRRYATQMAEHDKLMTYAQKHIPIAAENATRKAVATIAQRGLQAAPNPDGGGGTALPGAVPAITPAPSPAAPQTPMAVA